MMTSSIEHLLDAFDHMIEMLQDAGVDVETLSMVEGARDALIEEHEAMFEETDE